MTDAGVIVFLVSLTASLFLAVRAFKSHGLDFGKAAWMAAAWAAIIAALAIVLSQWGG